MTFSHDKSNNSKVIVIGAGVSGLACARELAHRKHQVLVVEARNRCGGRLKGQDMVNAATSTNTTPIDVGGALVHGITNNPIFQLCDQMGITTVPVSETVLLQADGTPVDPQVDEQVSELFNQCLDETFQKIQQSRNNNTSRKSQQSFGTLFDTTVPPNQKNLLFSWHQANLELSCGASFSHLGHDWNDDEPYEYMGAHVALQQSWNAVTETLAEDLNILYNAPIQSIRIVYPQEQQQDETKKRSTRQEHAPTLSSPLPTRKSRRLQGEDAHVRRSIRSTKGIASPLLSISDSTSLSYDADVRYSSSSIKQKTTTPTCPKVQVTLQNGKVLQADAVVCTLPLGILKLAPDEPGHVSFDPPLSNEKQHAIQTLGCGLLNKCVISFPHVFWQDAEFLGVVEDPPHLILNASIVTGQPILVFMFGGDYAFQVEDLTDAEIVKLCMNVLRKSCKTTAVPEPLDYVVTRWGHDVYARGAFVYIPPGVEGTKQLEVMSEPIVDENGRPLILFAGEHTTPFHPSTIHGAFSSGIREAYRVDLNFFPDWNNHLEFEPNHLYKKTFPVKRKFQKMETEHSVSRSQPPPRKRRHGVMTLRKRPPGSYAVNGSKEHVRVAPVEVMKKSPMPSRRSNRIAGEPVESTEHGQEKLENRTLVRSYESFRDWEVIDDKVFPVYGASPEKSKSIAQLRSRYQQLQTKRPRMQASILSSWVVPKEKTG